ncbi:MAG TPA: hypothetical protein VGG16_01910 [Streptosporangiaceae bacterium]
MIEIRQIRGFAVAGLLTAALAGCGTVVATGNTSGSTSGNGTSNTGTTTSSSTATGCASTSLATKVTVIRAMHLVEPERAKSMQKTQTNAAKVQALFRDFCQAIAHKDTKTAILNCPDQVGLSYGGAFYDGSRLLADYTYGASGCQRVTITAPGGKSQAVVVWGTAAAASPNMEADMGKVLGIPKSAVMQPYGSKYQKESGGVNS